MIICKHLFELLEKIPVAHEQNEETVLFELNETYLKEAVKHLFTCDFCKCRIEKILDGIKMNPAEKLILMRIIKSVTKEVLS